MAASPRASERARRLKRLEECFCACDANKDGFVDRSELASLALAFNADAEVEKEVSLVMSRVDKDKDGLISKQEWVAFLSDLFQFMNLEAFERHCDELFATLTARASESKAAADGAAGPASAEGASTA